MTRTQKREEAMIDVILEIFYDTKSKAAEEFLKREFEKSIGKVEKVGKLFRKGIKR